MPWKAFKVNDEFCVFRIDKDGNRFGGRLGCHATRTLANRQVAALNISESKQVEDKEKSMTETTITDDLHKTVVDATEEIIYTKNDNGQFE